MMLYKIENGGFILAFLFMDSWNSNRVEIWYMKERLLSFKIKKKVRFFKGLS